jgi:hypothetical protein
MSGPTGWIERSVQQAHQDLAIAAQHPSDLSDAERREVKDDLCLTEYLIGPALYLLPEEERVCAQALEEPGSVSGPNLAQIRELSRQSAQHELVRDRDGKIGGAVGASCKSNIRQLI